QVGGPRDLIGHQHAVDERRAPQQLLLLLLRHASRDADPGAAGGLHHPVAAQRRIELVLGLFADGAGVEQHQVRGFCHVCRRPPGARERFAHPGRIVLVHLAAEGVDEVTLLHGRRDMAEAWGGVNGIGHILLSAGLTRGPGLRDAAAPISRRTRCAPGRSPDCCALRLPRTPRASIATACSARRPQFPTRARSGSAAARPAPATTAESAAPRGRATWPAPSPGPRSRISPATWARTG